MLPDNIIHVAGTAASFENQGSLQLGRESPPACIPTSARIVFFPSPKYVRYLPNMIRAAMQWQSSPSRSAMGFWNERANYFHGFSHTSSVGVGGPRRQSAAVCLFFFKKKIRRKLAAIAEGPKMAKGPEL
jgi:hypothetical protein